MWARSPKVFPPHATGKSFFIFKTSCMRTARPLHANCHLWEKRHKVVLEIFEGHIPNHNPGRVQSVVYLKYCGMYQSPPL